MWRCKSIEARELRGHREFLECGAVAGARQPQPLVMERYGVEFCADGAETLEIALSRRTPVTELRAQTVGSLRRAHQGVFIGAEQA